MTGLDRAAEPLCLEGELIGQRPVGVLPPVGQQLRAGHGRLGPGGDRAQSRVAPQPLRAGPAGGDPLSVADLVAAGLEKLRLGQVLERDIQETANLAIRTGDTVRFIASAECRQVLRVGSREGMVFPAHRTTAGQHHLWLWRRLPSRLIAFCHADLFKRQADTAVSARVG